MDYLVCPICGAQKKQLTKHVTMAHKISKEKFLEMYPGTQMISNSTRRKHIEATKKNWEDDEYREKCSSYWNSDLHAQRKSDDMKKRWDEDYDEMMNTFVLPYARSEEGRKVRSEVMRRVSNELWKDPEYYKRRQRSAQKQQLESSNWRAVTRDKYNGTWYRSKWESYFAKKCDDSEIEFEYEGESFAYSKDDNGFIRKYIPDFYLPQYEIFIEIKPEVFIDELAKLKSEGVKRTGNKFMFITEKELYSDELFDIIRSTSQVTD